VILLILCVIGYSRYEYTSILVHNTYTNKQEQA